jgi:formylmethanofuran dehydrogenase subunit E-like metal-binding protein
VVLFSCTGGYNGNEITHLLPSALESLGAQAGNPNLCVLTNAPYVIADHGRMKTYMEMVSTGTGCSEKKENLLFFHRPKASALITAIFHRKSGDCVVINHQNQSKKTVAFTINRRSVETEDFWVKARTGLNHRDAFSVVSILGSWWLDAPQDFLKAAENHGHVCPGLVFGYMMAKTVAHDYPLQQGEAYFFVANHPTFCGNDALRVVLGVTEEKKNLFLKTFSKNQKEKWSIRNGTGVLVKWHEQKKRGQGVILGMDMDKLQQRTGFEKPSKAPEEMIPAVFGLIPSLRPYGQFVTVLWESPVEENMFEQLKRAEDDPYGIVGWQKRIS